MCYNGLKTVMKGMAMELKDYFPEMQVGPHPLGDKEWVSVKEGDQYVHFPKSCLSEKERLLLEVGLGQCEVLQPLGSPWQRYLLDHQGNPPQLFETSQFIYLNHQQALPDDLVELLQQMIAGLEVILPISATQTAFLCRQSISIKVLRWLEDLLPTLESDFGLALTMFVGNAWYQVAAGTLRECFEEECQLLTAYLRQQSGRKLLTFSGLMLWSLLSHHTFLALTRQFHQFLSPQSDMADVVHALWSEHGNLVQTAQRLYIHRNSLQYKLDKFAQQSGLHLKQLDDLAFAHLFLLKY